MITQQAISELRVSAQQQAIVDTYRKNPLSNICISAGAGTGKTTTLMLLSNYISSQKKVLFLAFNNAIVDELSSKLPSTIKCSTIHKIGLRTIYVKYGSRNIKISQWKTYSAVQKFLSRWKIPFKSRSRYSMRLSHLWDFYRLHNCTNLDDMRVVMQSQGLETSSQLMSHLRRLIQHMNEYNSQQPSSSNKFEIDLVDMIYLPIKLDLCFDRYDEVFVDESQDCNKLQQAIVKKLLKSSGRFISVGDPKQAIYSFAGADANSFEHFKQTPKTISLPLSVTYRCPKRIVQLANKVFPGLEAHQHAIDGVFRKGSVLDEAKAGDFVLCRNTAPLLQLSFELVAQQKKVTLKGDDMVKSLLTDLQSYKNMSCVNALSRLTSQQDSLIFDLQREGVRNPHKHTSVVKMENLRSAIDEISVHFSSMSEAYYAIKKLSETDVDQGIVLTTMHGSKGLEADNVFIIRKSLIPSKFATTQSQILQEKNLWYVAITRAKRALIIDDTF